MGSKLAIDVTASTTQAQNNIQNISDKITELANRKNSIVGVSTSIAAIGVAANTVKGIMQDVLNVSREWVNLYEKQVLSEKRLDVILKNVGTDAQMTSKSLKDYASSLQLVTRYGDETVISVEQILLETGKLNKDGLERATELSLDLAEAMGTDATSAAQTLALALQDPEAGLTRLRKAHVTFSEEEEKTIQNLIAEGRELEAQERILDKVAETYGGLAREIGSVDVSTLEKISNVWGDIKEDLGQGLLDAINPALETLYGWLVKIEKWIKHAADLQKATNAALRGESLEGFDEDILNEAIEELGRRQVMPLSIGDDEFATNMQMYQPTQTAEDIAIDKIKAELKARVEAVEKAAAEVAAEVINDRGWDYKFYSGGPIHFEDVTNRNLVSNAVANISNEGDSAEVLDEQTETWLDKLGKKINGFVDDVWDKKIDYVVSSAAQAINSISGLINQLYDNEISALDKQLSEMEEKWDKYFQNLDRKYKKDKKNLDAMYESGQMSAEEYEAELAKMDAARVKSEEDKEAELQKLQQRKQELERKQFEANKANQIAQATIAGAQSIAGIWASSGAYGLAGVGIAAALTAISAAAVGAQIATIASQQYVPALAEGGIVSKPTLALIGEAGPEAVVPLSKGYGGMTVVVQVENVYTSDDLSAAVYEGIRKLQGTGALPKWS